ncbi:MAG TPA: helicase HerA-like domain-containing protein, partial [Patescibacteria group bacterium]|nr:helicase HerA-like domain-containing protein [Patescibacteria group bacterium]
MRSTNPFPEPGVDPRLPVDQLADWLLGTVVHCTLGLAIGMTAARIMRARHLRWSWAALGLMPVVLAASSLGGSTSTIAIAALSAALWGRRWHREDIDAGADLAELAARRRGPLDVLRASVRRAAMRRRATQGTDGWFRGEELILGRDESCRAVSVPCGGHGGGRHTLVVGATGSGKTITQTWMAVRAIERGMGAIVVDPKGDRRMREEVRRAARAAGRRFVEWAPDGDAVYNPYARGSETEIADK